MLQISFLSFYLLFFFTGFSQTIFNPANIDIVRDSFGVPHIFAKTDAEVAYGLAWAEAEDDFKSMQEIIAVELSVNANTVARVYAELERAGVLETRRGVGSFVAAGRTEARPAGEKARKLRTFVTRVLADADRAGFTIDEVVDALSEHRTEGD